ncbi:ASC-1-like (ASCH) protein [Cytobacillus horneckiae]|uniref:hypothetical protein n=1 Tax=Cytobacillus horneckiae TaxID=549687 RepID=UPI0019D10F34|nr:hypothetical protein [Cytobacillus horneckiae]MBN6885215.1 hypothetical protein [Cytobacillus horneckiae]
MERNHRSKGKKQIKLVAGMLFVVLMVGSSFSIVFANEDMESMLTSWFEHKKADSIASIENAVAAEQEKQTARLKEEMRVKIAEADKQIQATTQSEIEKRVNELQSYTDELIQSFDPEREDVDETIAELNAIMQSAKEQMEAVGQSEQTK